VSSPEAFARGNGSYWNEITPRLESYVRSQMLVVDRFAPPLELKSSPRRHALVSELAFEQFAAEREGLVSARPARIADVVVEAVIARLREFADSPAKVRRPSPLERREAWSLRRRLLRFVAHDMQVREVRVKPVIPGCGSLRSAEGDLLGSRFEPDLAKLLRDLVAGVAEGDAGGKPTSDASVLYEVKSVNRRFGSQDVRQLLVYAAMYQAVGSPPRHIGLVNPRLGTFVEWRLNDLCLDIAGNPVDDVLQQIVTDVSVNVSA